jgi:hypothetical protein
VSHLQLDDGPELAPRRVSDHRQHALDDDRLRHVQALVRLALAKGTVCNMPARP